MTKLLTKKQQEREAIYSLVVKTFNEVNASCAGSQNLKLQETANRLKKHGINYSSTHIYHILKKKL
jgi:hypothetical protein